MDMNRTKIRIVEQNLSKRKSELSYSANKDQTKRQISILENMLKDLHMRLARSESNWEPIDYESIALTIELRASSPSWIWTSNPSINSRMLYRWATGE